MNTQTSRRQFVAGTTVAALAVSTLPVAAATAKGDRSEWEAALRHYEQAEAAADRHYKQVYFPLADKLERIEDAAGLDRARYGFWDRRKAFEKVNPKLYHHFNAASDECDRHGDVVSDALDILMDTPAPDLAALAFKLARFRDRDGLQPYTTAFIEQTYADIARLLPPPA